MTRKRHGGDGAAAEPPDVVEVTDGSNEPVVIEPTVGRVVLFHQNGRTVFPEVGPDERCAAVVARVVGAADAGSGASHTLNLMVIGPDGTPKAVTGVPLVQGGGELPAGTPYCHWMPYQLDQAARGG